MSKPKKRRPPGRLTIPGQASGLGNGKTGGAKNLRVTEGCHKLTLTTYNGRSLRLDESLMQLEVELDKIRWRRRIPCQQSSSDNVLEVLSVSTRVAYLVLKLTERYSLKVVQVYTPTSTCSDSEFEDVYEDVGKALHNTTKTYFTVVMGDYSDIVGVRECEESCIGQHGIGRRNPRGQMLVNFLDMQGLFGMNTFFTKKPHRKWTWQSPNGMTKNEIDFILTDKKRKQEAIFRDISVVNRFNAGSDHRLVRGTLNIEFTVERSRMMRSLTRPTLLQIMHGSEAFQLELSNRFALLETTVNVDKDPEGVVGVIREEGIGHFRIQRGARKSKLLTETLELMRTRRKMPEESSPEPTQQNHPQVATTLVNDPRATLSRHFTDDLPEVDEDEIGMALKQLNNGKAPSEDGTTSELPRAGGDPVLRKLKELFNAVIANGTTPEAWSRSVEALFFKKGDKTLLKNYRPIALLSHVCKLFSRVLTNHIDGRFNAFQPPEQARF
ncbi:uncharacterized protein LOC113229400 [Hyposmocoma kahamanoa]|uniref:uncharacterized protein LOC113229400 n=1 Tax=Hyposmocoma kahamanoa TaxID=1477025 RepID=UPI000E6D615C|nr:uncharacterized protein LOC113229400 [Hyposmocoma kahamanoa]